MKKVLYSIMMVAIALTGCTTWDDPVTENYGNGPAISIDVTATADSTFTFTLTPAAGAKYYSFVIDESDEADELDATTLLKGGYSSVLQAVLNAEQVPSFTYNMRNSKDEPLCEPNTTYQIYAVAANDKGIVGEVNVVSVTTTDAGAPQLLEEDGIKADAANKAVAFSFDQAILRGEGAVTAQYYKEYDIANPVTIEAEDITVSVKGNVATVSVANVPDGVYVVLAYEEGAFTDAYGNKCGAVAGKLSMVTGKFSDPYFRVPTKNWAVADEYFTAPEAGSTFPKWSEFEGTITFKEDVYVNPTAQAAGDLTVTYTNDSRTVTYKLATTDWTLGDDKKTITFNLPKATEPGDKVTVGISEGVLFDIYGNPNSAYSSEKVYWISFAMTKEDVLGTFTYVLGYNDNNYNLGDFTIEEYKGEDAEEGDVLIKDLYIEGSEISGYYVIDESKLFIYPYQPLGILNDPTDGDYGVLTYSLSGQKTIALDVNADGTLTSTDFALVASSPDYSELWWYETPSTGSTTMVKKEAEVAARKGAQAVSKKFNKQKVKGHKKFQLFRK